MGHLTNTNLHKSEPFAKSLIKNIIYLQYDSNIEEITNFAVYPY